MDFAYSQVQNSLQQRIRSLCETHCSEEQEAARDREPTYPHELYSALAKDGILSHCMPKEFGGQSGTFLDLVVISEELARGSLTAVTMMFINGACASIINLAGTPDQKQRLLTALSAGKLKLAFALTERGAGSDAGAIKTSARRDGTKYVINGSKYFTTGAMEADFILTVLRTHETEKIGKAASLLLVPGNATGLEKKPLDKIAGNALATCELIYTNVVVDEDQRIGAENAGWSALVTGAIYERLVVAAAAIGITQLMLEKAIAFANNREQFGQPIGRFQAIQHQIADIAMDLSAGRWMAYHAAWLIDQKQDGFAEVCKAKAFCSEMAIKNIEKAMKIFGGQAYLEETSLARRWRESMLLLYAGGTSEVQRNAIARASGL